MPSHVYQHIYDCHFLRHSWYSTIQCALGFGRSLPKALVVCSFVRLFPHSLKEKDTLSSFLHAVKSNCSHLVQPSNSHLLEIPVWAYDGHMGTVTVGVGGAWSCDCHVTHVTMVIHSPSVPSNELNGRILKHEKVKSKKFCGAQA